MSSHRPFQWPRRVAQFRENSNTKDKQIGQDGFQTRAMTETNTVNFTMVMLRRTEM